MYVSLRRLFVNMYASAHAQTVCLCYLAQCFQSPRTIVCVSVCICVCVLESLQLSHHIYLFWWLNISASLSSYPLGLHPDRHMSNNAWLESNNTMKSRTCTLLWETHWGRCLNRDQNWMDRVFHVIEHNYQVWLGTLFTIMLYEWGLCHEFEIDNPLSPVFECSVSAYPIPSLFTFW